MRRRKSDTKVRSIRSMTRMTTPPNAALDIQSKNASGRSKRRVPKAGNTLTCANRKLAPLNPPRAMAAATSSRRASAAARILENTRSSSRPANRTIPMIAAPRAPRSSNTQSSRLVRSRATVAATAAATSRKVHHGSLTFLDFGRTVSMTRSSEKPNTFSSVILRIRAPRPCRFPTWSLRTCLGEIGEAGALGAHR